jgi:hypothetical protein
MSEFNYDPVPAIIGGWAREDRLKARLAELEAVGWDLLNPHLDCEQLDVLFKRLRALLERR